MTNLSLRTKPELLHPNIANAIAPDLRGELLIQNSAVNNAFQSMKDGPHEILVSKTEARKSIVLNDHNSQ